MIWLAENLKWVWHLNLLSPTRVNDRRIKVYELEEITGIPYYSIECILHDHLYKDLCKMGAQNVHSWNEDQSSHHQLCFVNKYNGDPEDSNIWCNMDRTYVCNLELHQNWRWGFCKRTNWFLPHPPHTSSYFSAGSSARRFFCCSSAFVRTLVVSYVDLFCHCLFFVSHSFGASGRLCFVILVFPGYLYLHFMIIIEKVNKSQCSGSTPGYHGPKSSKHLDLERRL